MLIRPNKCKSAVRHFSHRLFVQVVCGWLLIVPAESAFSVAGVASASPEASQAGIKILNSGGNAFDAAVAISAVLAVVEPAGSGLGGGGFWLIHDVKSAQDFILDGREKAPFAATRDMYLDASGGVVKQASIDGALAAAIPGEPAALVWLAENYGVLPLSVTLQAAIKLAREGFTVTERYRRLANLRLAALNASAAADIFLTDRQVPPVGAVILQYDLANTLQILASTGHDGFYRGEVAQKLVDGVRAAGGIWTLEDLSTYQVKVREPVVAHYKDLKITSAALPSSGGLVMTQALNILSAYNLENAIDAHSNFTPDYVHLSVEAMRRAYRDRAKWMGDADFVEVPVNMLTDPEYADQQRQSIRLDRATFDDTVLFQDSDHSEGTDTTHFSVFDSAGNRVSATLSINYSFGSGLVPPGTGVLLNNEMDDFSAKPGVPNIYGLVGGEANSIAGGKRMLSSMSPTFLETNERIAAIGTPGGSRIISMVLLAALDFYRGASAIQLVDRPRFHHQYLPNIIQLEAGALSVQTIAELRARGHQLEIKDRAWGNMQVVIKNKIDHTMSAASDRRGDGMSVILK